MPDVSIVGPEAGHTVLSGPTQMRILEDGSHTAHRLGLGEITIAPRTEGPPQHRHAQHDEGFYVLSGTVRFTVGAPPRPPAPPGRHHRRHGALRHHARDALTGACLDRSMPADRAVLFRLATSTRLERAARAAPLGERLAWRGGPRPVAGTTGAAAAP